MSLPQIVRRYAAALFEAASEAGQTAEVEADMRRIEALLAELPQVREWCRSARPEGSDETFVETAFAGSGPLTLSTLRLAARYGRLAAIPLLPAAFQALCDRASGTTRVLVETAQDPDAGLVEGVSAAWEGRTKTKVHVTWRLRPELVGGFRVLWDDSVLDASARDQLRRLRSVLTAP